MKFENIDGRPQPSHRTAGWNEVEAAIRTAIPPETLKGNLLYAGALYGLAVVEQPKIVVEIGAQFGVSARVWLAAGAELVHSYDIDPKCAEMLLGPRWCFHLGRSQDITPVACDLLYVDGDHSYEAVCSDMARHGPPVRDGGLVILDDYHRGWPGKTRWIDERWAELDPIIIGPTAVVRVTSAKRELFGKVFP